MTDRMPWGTCYFFPNHYLIINTGQEEHMMTPEATLPLIISLVLRLQNNKIGIILFYILDDSS